MANTLRFKRGLVSTIPTAALGEPLFTTDTFDLYIGNGTTNTRFQKYIASGTTSQLLRGDGSLLTMPIVLTSPSNGQVLKYDGTNWVNSADAGVTGSGTAGQVTYWGSSSTITGSNSLFWDATNNRLGIGTNSLFTPLTVGTTNARFEFSEVSSILHAIESINTARSTSVELGLYNRALRVFTRPSGTGSYVNNFTITDNGRLLLGSTSDNGLRFQVTGDGFFSGSVGIGSTALTGNTLRIAKTITGGSDAHSILNDGTIQTDVTGGAFYNRTISRTAAGVTLTNLVHNYASQGTLSGTVNTQVGFWAESSLIGATNNYGFYGNIASGTGRWNLYMNGTAANYLNGSLGIGTTPSYKLHVLTDSVATRQTLSNINRTTANWVRFTNPQFAVDASMGLMLKVFPDSDARQGAGIIASGGTNNGDTNLALFVSSGVASSTSFAAYSTSVNSTGGVGHLFYNGAGTTAMTLDVLGNLLVGSTTAGGSATPINISLGSAFGTNTAGSTSNIKLRLYDDGVAANHYGFGVSSNLMEISAPSSIAFYNGSSTSRTERMRLNANGRLILGVAADSGETFQVNGTMRVSGASTIAGTSNGNILLVTGPNTGSNTIHITVPSGTSEGLKLTYNANDGSSDINNVFNAPLYFKTNNTTRLTITGTGAATFSSSVTAASLNVSGASTFGGAVLIDTLVNANQGNLVIKSTNNDASGLSFIVRSSSIDTNSRSWMIHSNYTAAGNFEILSSTSQFGNPTTPRLTIDRNGAATFSSSVTAGGNLLLSAGTASSVGAINLIRTGTSPVASRLTFGTDGTGYSFAIGKNQGGSITDLFSILDSGAATFSSTATATGFFSNGASNFATSSGNVGIGTVSPGYKLHVQTSGASGTSFGLRVQAGTNSSDAAMQILSQAGSTYLFLRGDNNLGFGTSLVGATGTNTMSVFSGTAPTTNVTDSFQMYSNDIVAGNAAPHFRTENGAVIKLYQQDNSIAAANFVAGIGTSVTTLDAFDGYTIGQVVKALRNAGILL